MTTEKITPSVYKVAAVLRKAGFNQISHGDFSQWKKGFKVFTDHSRKMHNQIGVQVQAQHSRRVRVEPEALAQALTDANLGWQVEVFKPEGVLTGEYVHVWIDL